MKAHHNRPPESTDRVNDLDNLSASFVSVWKHRFFPCETGRELLDS